MPLFGAHMSIAGGLHNALLTAQAHACPAVQLFTKNSNQWNARDITEEEVRLFKRTKRQAGIKVMLAHDSYLINLASPSDELYRKSIEAFIVEVQRADLLGLNYLVMHPGAPLASGEETGLLRVSKALDEVHLRCPDVRVKVLLETTAGQGTTLGWRFEHLARILERVADPDRLGVCFDTCHVFAAGYALWPEEKYHSTFQSFAKTIGLRKLKAFHINDSLRPLGSRVDRHAHIGKGEIGAGAFKLLVNDPRFRRHPMILETPKEEGDNKDMDAVNLRKIRSLLKEKGDASHFEK